MKLGDDATTIFDFTTDADTIITPDNAPTKTEKITAKGSITPDTLNITPDTISTTLFNNSSAFSSKTSFSDDPVVPSLEKDSISTFGTDSSSVATPIDEINNDLIKSEYVVKNAVADYDALVDKQRVQRLKFLLEKSSLYAQFLANKMERQQQEQRERAQAEEIRRAKAKEKQEKISAGPTLALTSDVAADNSSSISINQQQSTTKKRGAPKKRKADDSSYNILDYDISKRRKGDYTTAAVVENFNPGDYPEVEVYIPPAGSADEASKDKPDDDLENEEVTNNNQTNGDFDRSLISARQPKLVTGGILRDYQLTGFEWLVSLYDNGLNGILADEMGLGKTLQTIAFLAYLWENKIYGPFLIVAPLSTLANWVKRAHMRSRRLKKIDHTFPIVVTSYEIVMNDRKYLQKYAWKYIVVDEGHRIKNLNCKLIRELKTYQSANRLLLTGTPLQNNLAELWSLLNFLLPDIFDDLDNGETVILAKEQQNEVVSNLHRILKPFLLRRLKSDVEYALPKKKEFLLYAPLTRQQKEVYDAILSRNIRPFLLGKKLGRELDGDTMVDPMDIDNVDFLDNNETNSNQNENNKDNNQNAIQNADNNSTSSNNNDIINNNPDSISESYIRGSKLRRLKPRAYKEMTDDEFFDVIEKGEDEISQEELLENNIIAEKETKTNRVVKSVNCMKLQNAVMQLRKICNHPYLFDWPVDPETDTYQISKELIAASGKMILLKRLLDALFERDHKVLIFSQFTTMLDIIEDWATTYENWQLCRIDGSIDQETRRKQIQEFNTNPKIKLFILSTRAGGLGINLTAADTVIIYDSDWNPQIDLQAQDRVHRIGQTRPVIIYRMVTANTIECKILEKASAKRKLEKLVIHKGKFKLPTSRDNPIASLAELEEILAGEDNEKVQLAQLGDEIIPDTDLVRLLDRSEEAFEKVGTAAEQEERGRIFKVISEVRDQNNDALAQMSNQD
ncbi:9502_t:CDS:10 [Entrophospora sp. SA101]|nr:9502_t:CDS:10 [Entrophospora sp. SA101]